MVLASANGNVVHPDNLQARCGSLTIRPGLRRRPGSARRVTPFNSFNRSPTRSPTTVSIGRSQTGSFQTSTGGHFRPPTTSCTPSRRAGYLHPRICPPQTPSRDSSSSSTIRGTLQSRLQEQRPLQGRNTWAGRRNSRNRKGQAGFQFVR